MKDELAKAITEKDAKKARLIVMDKVAELIATKKPLFIKALRDSGISVSDGASDAELVSLFYANASTNKELVLKLSFLISAISTKSSADGSIDVSDAQVKTCYKVMKSNFIGDNYSNIGAGEIIKAVGDLGSSVTKSVGDFQTNQQKAAYEREFGAAQARARQNEIDSTVSAQKMLAIIDLKKAQAGSASKPMSKGLKTGLIIGGSVLGFLLIVGVVIYMRKKK
jgi:hypothetical protein